MSQGFDTPISKEQIAIITGQDEWYMAKIQRRVKRSGWKKVYQSIRGKE
jgi:hypothetical protein